MPNRPRVDYDKIERLWRQGLDRQTIAERLGCTPAVVSGAVRRRKLATPGTNRTQLALANVGGGGSVKNAATRIAFRT